MLTVAVTRPLVCLALIIAVFTVTASLSSTGAAFSDTVTSNGNAFSATSLNPPTSVSGTQSGASLVLTWTATTSTWATGYDVLRSATSGGPYSSVGTVTPATATTFTDTPASDGTYYYVLRSYYQSWTSSNSVQATVTLSPITFRSAASGAAAAGVTTLTINKPAGTALNDVMIASIAMRPETITITPPSGWVYLGRIDNGNANQSSQVGYYKVAGGSEPASYSWTLSASHTGAVGGILTFRNVSTTALLDTGNVQNTPSGLVHTTPSVTTTGAGRMIITSHSLPSSATWTPPSGMTEAVDIASGAVPSSAGISIEVSYVYQAAAGATGTKSATASNDADVGNAGIIALKR